MSLSHIAITHRCAKVRATALTTCVDQVSTRTPDLESAAARHRTSHQTGSDTELPRAKDVSNRLRQTRSSRCDGRIATDVPLLLLHLGSQAAKRCHTMPMMCRYCLQRRRHAHHTIRFVLLLLLLGANPDAAFTRLLYGITSQVLFLFQEVVPDLRRHRRMVEVASPLAMVASWLLGKYGPGSPNIRATGAISGRPRGGTGALISD